MLGSARAFTDSKLQGLMTVFRNDGAFDRSNVLFRDGRILRYDKRDSTPEMRHIDYGLGAPVIRQLHPCKPLTLEPPVPKSWSANTPACGLSPLGW